MWTVREEPPDRPEAVALLREYFAELTVRYFHRATTEKEIDETVAEYPSTGLAAFFVLLAGDEPAGCLGVHHTGEITRMYVSPRFRRAGGARALLASAEAYARARGLTRLFLDHPRRPHRSTRAVRFVRLRRDRTGDGNAGAVSKTTGTRRS